jgi:2',3'-cyclic-nucleotide 2'-phosphodiesterase (5'-nucleotidase family)
MAVLCIIAQCSSLPKETTLTILYTGRGNGALTGCDCPDGLPGGLARRATIFDSVRQAVPHTLAVDAGDFLNTYSDRARNAAILTVLPRLGYDAVNVGDQEFIEGREWLQTHYGQLPLLSANILDGATRRPMVPPVRLIHISSIRIAIIGISARSSFELVSLDSLSGLTVAAPESSLAAEIGRVRKNTGLVVVLSQLGWEQDTVLARQVPGIDLVIGGHRGPVVREPYRVDRTLVVQTGERGEEIGVLTLTLDRSGKISAWKGSHIALGRGVREDTVVVKLIDEQMQQ